PSQFVIVLTFQALSRSLSVSARTGKAGNSQIFSQFQFHLDRCFNRHRVQMFVKLWHQAHAIFPDDPSRLVAVFVILESVIDWDSCHADIDARLQGDRVWDSAVKWKDALLQCRSAESRKRYGETFVPSETFCSSFSPGRNNTVSSNGKFQHFCAKGVDNRNFYRIYLHPFHR